MVWSNSRLLLIDQPSDVTLNFMIWWYAAIVLTVHFWDLNYPITICRTFLQNWTYPSSMSLPLSLLIKVNQLCLEYKMFEIFHKQCMYIIQTIELRYIEWYFCVNVSKNNGVKAYSLPYIYNSYIYPVLNLVRVLHLQ